MKILVHGAAGRMGTVLRQLIVREDSGATLAGAVSHGGGEDFLSTLEEFTGQADCIIDFSNHEATKDLTAYAVAHKLPLVIATTGQTEQEMELIQSAAKTIPVFYSGNMSLGIALLTEMARMAAKVFPEADIEIVEQHHNRKLDVPSGTALMLAHAVQEVRPDAVLNVGRHENGERSHREIGIHSLRMGNTVGVHEVIVNTGTQVLTLKHEAQDRSLFAEGALSAAKFVMGQAPGLYHIENMVNEGTT